MTTIAKTFLLEADLFCPKKIKEELEKHFSVLENDSLRGTFYFIDDGEVFRYYWNLFEIMTHDQNGNHQIKSQIEDILGIKLREPN